MAGETAAAGYMVHLLRPIYQVLDRNIRKRVILCYGASGVGKTTLINQLAVATEEIENPGTTKQMKKKIFKTKGHEEKMKIMVWEVGGQDIFLDQHVRAFIEAKKPVIIYLFRGFRINEATGGIEEHDYLFDREHAPFKIAEGLGIKLPYVKNIGEQAYYYYRKRRGKYYNELERTNFEFVVRLITDWKNIRNGKFKGVFDNSPGLFKELRDEMIKREKIHRPRKFIIAVNMMDEVFLNNGEFSTEEEMDYKYSAKAKEFLKPYSDICKMLTKKEIPMKVIGISAKYGKNIKKLIYEIQKSYELI